MSIRTASLQVIGLILDGYAASNNMSIAFYLQGPEGVALADDARRFVHSLKPQLVKFAPFSPNPLPDGPYFATRYGLHRAWRLYDDFTNSFTLASVPSDQSPDIYEPLAAKSGSQLGGISVAVPSRLFYTPTAEKPLAGYRVAVKDEYEINGLITTYGSRAYAKTYPPANKTSGVIQSLIDQGAIIVGKTKLSLFAGALFTASEWTDYELPIV